MQRINDIKYEQIIHGWNELKRIMQNFHFNKDVQFLPWVHWFFCEELRKINCNYIDSLSTTRSKCQKVAAKRTALQTCNNSSRQHKLQQIHQSLSLACFFLLSIHKSFFLFGGDLATSKDISIVRASLGLADILGTVL